VTAFVVVWPGAAGAGIVGRTWSQEAMGRILRLEADGSYVVRHPGGTSSGTYVLQGDVLVTQAPGGVLGRSTR